MVKKKEKQKARSAKSKVKRTAKRIKAKKVTKVSIRRPAKKGIKKTPQEVSLEKIGEVTHYFPHVKAAAVKILKDGMKVGDDIYIKGHTTDFKERIDSMQLDHLAIQEGRKGQEIGLLVKNRVRIGDSVYRI